MDVGRWVLVLLLGGMLGQGIRVVTGLKKVNDQAVEEGKRFADLFDGTQLLVSLLIGFVT